MGIAILWVVLFHISLNIQNEWFSVFFGKGHKGVDIFVMLSVFGLCKSFEKNTLATFYKNRVKRIFPLYLFFIVGIILLDIKNEITIPTWKFLLLQCTGLASFTDLSVEWFIPFLLCLYILFPLLYYMGKFLYTHYFKLSIVAIPFLGIMANYLWPYMNWLIPHRLLIIYITLLLFFPIKENHEKRLYTICIASALTCFLFGNAKCTFSIALYLPVIMLVMDKLKPSFPLYNLISLVGKHSLELYLAHFITIVQFGKTNLFELNTILNYLVLLIMTIILTWLFSIVQRVSLKLLELRY